MHRDYRPCQIQSFVDDIPQMHTGHEEVIANQATEQALDLVARLQGEGFQISAKSTVVASSTKLAKRIVDELAKQGVKLTVADVGWDLGVDFAAGARRRITLQRSRFAKVQRGTNVVLKMSHTLKETRKLELTAIKPRAWGVAAQGCSPSMAKALRSNIGRGLNIKKAGGYLNTAFHMHGYSTKDPWLSYSIDNILYYMQGLIDLPAHHRLAAKQVWEHMRDALEGKYRWAKVKGPMGSAIATLWDWGFVPIAYDQWTDPTGATWFLDYNNPCCIAVAREVLEHHFMQRMWKMASLDQCLQRQPDLTAYFGLRKDYQKLGLERQLYFLEAVVQGAIDFHTEAHLAFEADSNAIRCSKCKQVVGGDSAWAHFALSCTCPAADEDFAKTEAYKGFLLSRDQARHEAGQDSERSAYWLRGLYPLLPLILWILIFLMSLLGKAGLTYKGESWAETVVGASLAAMLDFVGVASALLA